MARIYAELQVAGRCCEVLHSEHGLYEPIDQIGRPNSTVHVNRIKVWLAGPGLADSLWPSWSFDPYRRLSGRLVFYEEEGRTSSRLVFRDAYCIHYGVLFDARGTRAGWPSLVVALHLSAAAVELDGQLIEAHSVLPWATDQATRLRALTKAPEPLPSPELRAGPALEQETDDAATIAMGGLPDADEKPTSGLATLIENSIRIDEPEAFREAVLADLEKIYATPTGKKLLESLAKSGKTVGIEYTMFGNGIGGYDVPEERFFKADGTCGIGTSSKISYHPTRERIGPEPWETRPAAVGLAHELIHAEQAAYGRMRTGKAKNGTKPSPSEDIVLEADVRELEAVGIPPHDGYQFSEKEYD